MNIQNSSIVNNKALCEGGGISFWFEELSNMTVVDSDISNNESVADDGGGIFFDGPTALSMRSDSSIVIEDSTISANKAFREGSGIKAQHFGNVTVKDYALIGAYGESDSSIVIEDSTISANKAFREGGGIKAHHFGNVNIKDSSISSNISDGYGASALLCENCNKVVCDNSVFSNNVGDGIIDASWSRMLVISNSVIRSNKSWEYGIIDGGGTYQFLILNSIVADNTSYYSSHIYAGASPAFSLVNSVIVNNLIDDAVVGAGSFVNNIFYENQFNDIWFTGNSFVYNNYVDYGKLANQSPYSIIKKNNIQPSAGPINFANSAYRLAATSIAIDKGLAPSSQTFVDLFTDPTVLGIVTDVLSTDKDGNKRINGPAIDLGAYEFGSIPFAPKLLSAKATSSNKIILTWKDNSTNETKFEVDRKIGTCSSTNAWARIGFVKPNIITYTNTGLTSKKIYSYRLKVYNALGKSSVSNCMSATTLAGTLDQSEAGEAVDAEDGPYGELPEAHPE